MSDFDQSEIFDISPTLLTRDFIGLCIGIISVILVILIVAICKCSRCLCLKRRSDNTSYNDIRSSILQQTISTSDSDSQRYNRYSRYYHHPIPTSLPGSQQYQRWSSTTSSSYYGYPSSIYRQMSHGRNDLTPSMEIDINRHRLNDIKVPRFTITALPIQPSQQLVPRLSMSPETSGSSITRSSYSFK